MKGKSCEAILANDGPCTSTFAAVSVDCYKATPSNVFNPTQDPNAASDANSVNALTVRPEFAVGAPNSMTRFQTP